MDDETWNYENEEGDAVIDAFLDESNASAGFSPNLDSSEAVSFLF